MQPILKILDLEKLFAADAPMKKKTRNLVSPPSQSTLKYGSENRVRGLSHHNEIPGSYSRLDDFKM